MKYLTTQNEWFRSCQISSFKIFILNIENCFYYEPFKPFYRI